MPLASHDPADRRCGIGRLTDHWRTFQCFRAWPGTPGGLVRVTTVYFPRFRDRDSVVLRDLNIATGSFSFFFFSWFDCCRTERSLTLNPGSDGADSESKTQMRSSQPSIFAVLLASSFDSLAVGDCWVPARQLSDLCAAAKNNTPTGRRLLFQSGGPDYVVEAEEYQGNACALVLYQLDYKGSLTQGQMNDIGAMEEPFLTLVLTVLSVRRSLLKFVFGHSQVCWLDYSRNDRL